MAMTRERIWVVAASLACLSSEVDRGGLLATRSQDGEPLVRLSGLRMRLCQPWASLHSAWLALLNRLMRDEKRPSSLVLISYFNYFVTQYY